MVVRSVCIRDVGVRFSQGPPEEKISLSGGIFSFQKTLFLLRFD